MNASRRSGIRASFVAATLAIAATQATARAPQDCSDCYWTRHWTVSPTYWKDGSASEFPETTQLNRLRPYSLGVAFSGGGTRSAAATVGQLRALVDNGWLPNVRYVTAVSGGSWAAVPFTFSRQPLSELLDFPTDIKTLTRTSVSLTKHSSLARSIASSKLARPGAEEALELLARTRAGGLNLGSVPLADLLDRLFGRSGGADTTYSDLLERLFIAPHLNERATFLFNWDGASQKEMFDLNPGLAGQNFIQPIEDRPFLIAGGTMFYTHPAFDFPRLIPVEYTPLYTGVRQQYGPHLGGGYVWPWAYDSNVVGPAASDRVRVRIDLTRRRFTLADIVGSSGAAPQLFLFRNARLQQAADFFPAFSHYSVRSSPDGFAATGLQGLMHGDGGFTDNLGLMPLLARQVQNIMVFVNGKNEIDENISVKSLFWPVAVLDDSGGDRSMNVVFESADYETLTRGLFNAAKTGPAVYCMRGRKVLANELYNIRGYDGLNICWIYNRETPAWRAALPDDIQTLMQSKRFDRFPWFRTFEENVPRVIQLGNDQVVLLAHLSYWSITNSETRQMIRNQLREAGLN